MSLPVLVAAPGMTAREVAHRSSVGLRPTSVDAPFATMQPFELHEVRVPCREDLVVALEPGRFSLVEVRRGVVARTLFTPMPDALALEPTLEFASTLSARLAAAGFDLEQGLPSTVAADLVRTRGRSRFVRLTAPFGSGSWYAELRIKTLARAGSELARLLKCPEGRHVVELELVDAVLAP
jgi:hypothetical protein